MFSASRIGELNVACRTNSARGLYHGVLAAVGMEAAPAPIGHDSWSGHGLGLLFRYTQGPSRATAEALRQGRGGIFYLYLGKCILGLLWNRHVPLGIDAWQAWQTWKFHFILSGLCTVLPREVPVDPLAKGLPLAPGALVLLAGPRNSS